jgi:hypothetical protein
MNEMGKTILKVFQFVLVFYLCEVPMHEAFEIKISKVRILDLALPIIFSNVVKKAFEVGSCEWMIFSGWNGFPSR